MGTADVNGSLSTPRLVHRIRRARFGDVFRRTMQPRTRVGVLGLTPRAAAPTEWFAPAHFAGDSLGGYQVKIKTLTTLAILAGALGIATACGGGGGGADCSACSESAKAQCEQAAKDCKKGGGNSSQCQQAIDVICGLSGGVGGGAGTTAN